jgi:mono/diheme cytochrome c family protein
MAFYSTRLVTGFVFAIGFGGVANGADANHGAELAKRWCAGCHIVAPDQSQGSDEVPSFASIARKPGFGADKLTYFLLDPHPKMPDMALTRREAEDLAAYIARLGR